MKNNETGEFELVVGDRQLLSAFFIVVLLCAVAFAMGYVVGQSAPKAGKVTAETAPATSPAYSAETRPQPLPPAPTPAASAPTEPDAKPADSSPHPTTQPSQGSEPPPAPVSTSATGLVSPEDLPTGNFWQVMAGAQPQAENLRITLKDHGFPVILSPGSKGLTRVLVGPYGDTQSFAKAKTELENAGMGPVRYKP
jgi:cell division septation protein DedD